MYATPTQSPKSSGGTTPTYVLSLGAFCEYEDTLSQGGEFSKVMVKQHLATFKSSTEDNLMSWTAYLLLASQLAIPLGNRQEASLNSRRRQRLDLRYLKLPMEPSCVRWLCLKPTNSRRRRTTTRTLSWRIPITRSSDHTRRCHDNVCLARLAKP